MHDPNITRTGFRHHPISAFFLGLYYAAWAFNYWFFLSGNASYPDSCGAANGALIMMLILLSITYVIVVIIRLIFARDKRFFKFVLALVFAPLVLSLISIFFLTVFS